MADLKAIATVLIEMNISGTRDLTKAALDEGVPARQVLEEGLIAGLNEVGNRFECGESFLPELLLAGEAMKAGMAVVKPALLEQEGAAGSAGKAAMGSVKGDVHDIGKNIVIMMLEGNGWEVVDLGVDVAPEDFCAAVKDGDIQVLGLSSLLTTTMPNQELTIKALEEAGLRDKVKVAVGGSVMTQDYAEQIGADCYASDAVEAVRKFAEMVK